VAKQSSWRSPVGWMLGMRHPNWAIDYFVEIMTDFLLILLPADLIYLYFAGAWYDSRVAIEIAEVVLLCFISLFGVWRLFRYSKGLLEAHHRLLQ